MNGETCATCDSFERCFSSGRELSCGICRERWSRMWDANGRVDILGASVCTVEEGQRCGRWREREDG